MATTMRWIKSSLKLGSQPSDNDIRSSSGTSLKRSNAKLQKANRSAGTVEIPEESWIEDLQSNLLQPPEPFRYGNYPPSASTSSSMSSFLASPSTLSLPHEVFGPDFTLTSSRGDSSHVESGVKPTERRLHKLFGKPRHQRPQPPDNFTRWEDRRARANKSIPLQPFDSRGSIVDHALAAAVMSSNAVAAGPSNSQAKRAFVESNPFSEAMRVRQSWASKPDHANIEADEVSKPCSKNREKRQTIRDIDWNEYNTAEELYDFLRSFDEQVDHSVNNISPIDSGVGLAENERQPTGKGKSHAVQPNIQATYEEFDSLLALQRELHDAIARQQQYRDAHGQAIDLEKEQQLGKDYQMEEDQITAKWLAQEEHEARERQEEEDHRRAKELARAEEARIAAELLKPRECVCCGDEKDPSRFPAHPPTYSCQHTSQTCTNCMVSWMDSEFSTKGCTDLKCPECPQTLSHDDVLRASSKKTFLAYEKLLTRNLLGSFPDFSWCLNPAGCESGQENSANNNHMQCTVCKYRQCTKHQCAWHSGESCDQYEYRTSGQKSRDEEAATAAMLDDVSKKCPGKNCGWRIQKTDGCDHMTCRKCRHEFCWECLASHKEIKRVGNTAHQDWCKFHSKNLGTSWPFNAH